MNVKDTINIFTPLLNAMAYAHKRGIIHGDINPNTVLITPQDRPRLMGFAINTLLNQLNNKNNDDDIKQTLSYNFPEQCEKNKLTAASDIFSLGLILYEIVTGKKAVDADNKYAIINKIVNEEILYPNSIDTTIKKIIEKALFKKPEQRHADTLDMRQDLLDHQQNITTEDTSPSNNKKNESETNSTLQFLLRRMEHKKDFQTMSHQVVEISQKAKASGDTSANILSNAILKDYSLSSKLLRLVNSPLYGQYGGRISSGRISIVSRAVVILGFEEVRNAALGLMLLDHLKDKNQANSLKEACINSMISGSLANGVADKMNIKDKEEAYACSMFHQLGKLLSIYYFPEETEIIFDLVKQKKLNEQAAAESVLGVNFEDIGIAVGESWQLPAELIDSMHSLPEGELKKPLSQADLLKHVSGFSNEYCEMIATSNTQDRQQNFENLASRYSNSMSISRSQMEDILSNALDEMEKYARLVNLDLGKSDIFNKANKWIPSDSSDKSNEETNKTPDLTEIPEQQSQIIDAIQEITDAILEGAPLNDILVMVMETIFTSFNFHRIMFCFINKGRTSISARFGFGPDIEEIKNRFSIPNGGEDIFNMSLKQAKDLIIEDTSAEEAVNLIPVWYRENYAKKSLLAYPIVVKNIPVGLLYIDSTAPISVADESRLGPVKTLRNQIVLAIRQA